MAAKPTTEIELTEQTMTRADGSTFNTPVPFDRWTKGGHDRLYLNNTRGVEFVDVADGSVHMEEDAPANITTSGERDGDTITLNQTREEDDGEWSLHAVFEIVEVEECTHENTRSELTGEYCADCGAKVN